MTDDTCVFTDVSFLWYNVIGCLVVVGVGMAVSAIGEGPAELDQANQSR